MAVATPPLGRLSADFPRGGAGGHACCPNCGHGLADADETSRAALLEAQRRIADLEAQVQLLNQKASAAIDRWADYEDELSRLRAAASQLQSPTTTATTAQSVASPTHGSFLPAGAANRLSALLSRKSTPNLRGAPSAPPPPPSPPPSARAAATVSRSSTPGLPSQQQPNSSQQPHHSHTRSATATSAASAASGTSAPRSPTHSSVTTTEDLLEALSREQNLRLAAESRLSTTSREVEELSVSLFEQANDMVATERRARAKLEERVEVLERRDVDKRRRLDRLDQAMGRIEHVRALLAQDKGSAGRNTARPAVEEKRSW